MNGLLVTEVARKVGIHVDTLRRYERQGTIPKARRHPVSGWRIYSPADVAAIQRVLGGNGAAEGSEGAAP